MRWQDFLYFSKTEKRAIFLLLFLIIIAGLLLYFSNYNNTGEGIENVSSTVQQKDSATTQQIDNFPIKSTKDETTTERVERLTSKNFKSNYVKQEKLAVGNVVELNSADTTLLKKIPGIGSVFAKRIVKYRELLGGYVSVNQLGEVFGIDEDKFVALSPWFRVDASTIKQLPINTMSADSLRMHPYISYRQAQAIIKLRKKQDQISSIEDVSSLKEFTKQDLIRISYYLSFD